MIAPLEADLVVALFVLLPAPVREIYPSKVVNEARALPPVSPVDGLAVKISQSALVWGSQIRVILIALCKCGIKGNGDSVAVLACAVQSVDGAVQVLSKVSWIILTITHWSLLFDWDPTSCIEVEPGNIDVEIIRRLP
jgi:hypothetical protein